MKPAPLTDRQEEVLSYLQGLVPIGWAVGIEVKKVAQTNGIPIDVVRRALKSLAQAGFIEPTERIAAYREYRVVRRLEDVERVT